MDRTSEIPVREQEQNTITLKGLVGATIETAKLYKQKDVSMVGALALVGMKAAFPERFRNSRLKQGSDLQFFNSVIWLGVEVNDAVDIIPQARKIGRQDVVEEIFGSWKKVLRVNTALSDGLESRLTLLNDYQREMLFVEKRSRELSGAQTLSDIRDYREVMNAISIVHNAVALLGGGELGQRVGSLGKDHLSWDALHEKYGWLMVGSPQNETERRLCALYNLVMGVQVVDDYNDMRDDSKLGLRTLASELMKQGRTTEEGEVLIKAEAEKYFRRAEEFGVSESAWRGMTWVFGKIKGLQSRFPGRWGGRRERMLNGGSRIVQELTEEG